VADCGAGAAGRRGLAPNSSTVEGDKITIRVDMSSNEIRANQDETRFFRIDGNMLTLRTPEIVSAVRPGQKAVGTITFERER
jgi:hypothetical protein